MWERRKELDARLVEMRNALEQGLLGSFRARHEAHPGEPAVEDVLVISGGGDWGAFGVRFLKGWPRMHGPLAKPQFDVVTGVSTGALIAPFAFLGDAPALEAVVTLYRNPEPDWVKTRGAL